MEVRESMDQGLSEARKGSADAGDLAPEFIRSEAMYDCWNRIGVGGNASCRELLRYTHCRNCPVYSAGATQLLDRPLMPGWRDEWTEHYAREKKHSTPARTSVVIFRLGSEWLALPTPTFQEVAENRRLHTLPHRSRRGIVLGLVNIRGELLICVSLGRLLGLPEASGPLGRPTTRPPHTGLPWSAGVQVRSPAVFHRLLVTNWQGPPGAPKTFGSGVFPVDEVQGILRVHHDQLREPPPTNTQKTVRFSESVFTWREQTVGLLDAPELFAAVENRLRGER